MSDDDLTGVRVRQVEAALHALNMAAEDLAGRAARLAPLEEGTLRGSFAVVLIVNGRRHEGEGAYPAAVADARAAVRMGGRVSVNAEVSANTVYAARQHEELDWHHTDGQAKYLEQPFREQIGRYERIIGAAVARTV